MTMTPSTFVRESGQGVPVLCLHSNASASSQWRGLMEVLAPRYRMVAPDLLGAGRSAPWPVASGARLQHELDALAPVLQALGERFHLVGHSYGAALAMVLAQSAPQRVVSAVLYEPTTFPMLQRPGPGDPAATGIAAAATAAITAVDQGDLDAAAEGFIDYWMGTGSWAAMPLARRGPVAESMRSVRQWTEAIFAQPWTPAGLARLAMPVLLLGGERSPGSARDLLPLLVQALPQAALQLLPGLGHMAPVTHPDQVNPQIEAFLLGRT